MRAWIKRHWIFRHTASPAMLAQYNEIQALPEYEEALA